MSDGTAGLEIRSRSDAGQADEPAVRLEHVSKQFNGRTVLDNLSFEIAAGRSFCLLGRSGTGKSVTLRHIIGLVRMNDDELYRRAVEIAKHAEEIASNARDVVEQARQAVVNLQAKDGPGQGKSGQRRSGRSRQTNNWSRHRSRFAISTQSRPQRCEFRRAAEVRVEIPRPYRLAIGSGLAHNLNLVQRLGPQTAPIVHRRRV